MSESVVLVGIGGNLPGRAGGALGTCRAAVAALDLHPGWRVGAVSRWYGSTPVPASAQPPYVNGVVALRTALPPLEVLRRLLEIEAAHGRARSVPNAARTLDLDLLAADGLIMETEDLILPHPRLHERRFVLAPLAEIAAGWRHPRHGTTAEEMLADVPPQPLWLASAAPPGI